MVMVVQLRKKKKKSEVRENGDGGAEAFELSERERKTSGEKQRGKQEKITWW